MSPNKPRLYVPCHPIINVKIHRPIPFIVPPYIGPVPQYLDEFDDTKNLQVFSNLKLWPISAKVKGS